MHHLTSKYAQNAPFDISTQSLHSTTPQPHPLFIKFWIHFQLSIKVCAPSLYQSANNLHGIFLPVNIPLSSCNFILITTVHFVLTDSSPSGVLFQKHSVIATPSHCHWIRFWRNLIHNSQEKINLRKQRWMLPSQRCRMLIKSWFLTIQSF